MPNRFRQRRYLSIAGNSLAVGEHAFAGALRFFGTGDLAGEPYAEDVLRRFFEGALLATFVTDRLLHEIPFQCATFHHGIYVPQGLIGEVTRHAGVRVVNWIQAYRKRCFIFSHDDTYHHTMMTEPTDRWENMSWNSEIEDRLLGYLKSRWKGTRDWISFHSEPQFDLGEISREIGIDFSKPTVGMLTNVMWDAQLHYPANAFPNMREWVTQTIAYFKTRPDLQLLIRVHPAELTGMVPSRQKVVDEVKKAFPTLPQNVFIIPPESRVSTYAAMLQCDAVIIYGTKTGVELTSIGIPVIVAGEAWIRNKGITLDAGSIKAYLNLLDHLPLDKRLDDETKRR
ncbi:MAG: capsule biosynthesis protein, partial [Deltaproteobacteria bacterium]|nr:capsule biosynthesis protein [Deltaproteobacteria bacterium]